MNRTKKILIVVLILLVCSIDIHLFFGYINKKEINNNINNESEEVVLSSIDKIEVEFEDIKFNVPSEYRYKIIDNRFYVSYNDIWSINIQKVKVKYNDILYSRRKIMSNYEKNGYNLEKISEKMYNSNKYLIFKLEDSNYNHYMVYTLQDKNSSLIIEVVSTMDIEEIIDKIDNIRL